MSSNQTMKLYSYILCKIINLTFQFIKCKHKQKSLNLVGTRRNHRQTNDFEDMKVEGLVKSIIVNLVMIELKLFLLIIVTFTNENALSYPKEAGLSQKILNETTTILMRRKMKFTSLIADIDLILLL